MSRSLNSGFSNNRNVITIRTSGSSLQRVTDRDIDFDADGDEEKITTTTALLGNNKTKTTVTVPAGAARSIVERTNEVDVGLDGGVGLNDGIFTEGAQ